MKDKVTIITPVSKQSRGCQLSIRLHNPIDNINYINQNTVKHEH